MWNKQGLTVEVGRAPLSVCFPPEKVGFHQGGLSRSSWSCPGASGSRNQEHELFQWQEFATSF